MTQKFIDFSNGTYAPFTAESGTTATDHSGTITVGGTAQTGIAANANRRRYRLMNIDPSTETLWYRDDGGDAVVGGVGSWPLAGDAAGLGGYSQGTSVAKISVIAATTGHKFTLTEEI
jgi:hypothetical protein